MHPGHYLIRSSHAGTGDTDMIVLDRHSGRSSAPWLERLCSSAKVHRGQLNLFMSLVGEEGEGHPESLLEAMLHLSGVRFC